MIEIEIEIEIEIQKAEGFHKFLVSLLGHKKEWIWSDFLTAKQAERAVKRFCYRFDKKGVEVQIVGEHEVLKELDLLRPAVAEVEK